MAFHQVPASPKLKSTTVPPRHISNITKAETTEGSELSLHYSAYKPKGKELETLKAEGPLFPKIYPDANKSDVDDEDDLEPFECELTAQTLHHSDSKPEP